MSNNTSCQSMIDRRVFLGEESSGDGDCNDALSNVGQSPIHLDCFIGCNLEKTFEKSFEKSSSVRSLSSSIQSLTMGSSENDEELLSGVVKAAQSRLRRKFIDDKLIATIAEMGTVGCMRHSQIELGDKIGIGSCSNVFSIKSLQSNDGDRESESKQNEKKSSNRKKNESDSENLIPSRLVIKILKPDLVRQPSMLSMCTADLVKEGAILASLGRHPNIVSLVAWTPTGLGGFRDSSCGIRHDAFFLVLSRLEKSLEVQLDDWRNDSGKLKAHLKGSQDFFLERLRIIVELASAIQHVHSKGIVHRDLKPNNIGFDALGKLKLFDFDVARILPKVASKKLFPFRSKSDENETFRLTQHVGTQRYMSPECARGEPYNTKADVYSFGLVFHEVLSLERPFSKNLDAEDHYRSVYLKHRRPFLPKHWPRPLRNFIKNCWSDSISNRPTMNEASDFLTGASRNPVTGFDKKRNKNYSMKGYLRRRILSLHDNTDVAPNDTQSSFF